MAGPLLWQLPPDFKRDEERLQRFLAALLATYQHTLEFRYESWLVDSVFGRVAEDRVAPAATCVPWGTAVTPPRDR